MVRKSEGLKELVSKEPLQDITLLDFFACFALLNTDLSRGTVTQVAFEAYSLAEAMIEERKRK